MRDIRETLEEAGIDAPKFGGVYKGGNGEERPCFQLPHRECDLVISGYSVKYGLVAIDEWSGSRSTAGPVMSSLEARHRRKPSDPASPESLSWDPPGLLFFRTLLFFRFFYVKINKPTEHPHLPGFDGTPGYPIKNTAQPFVPTMSSLEIARLTGKDHRHVMRDIRETLEEAGIGAPKFGRTYLDSQNKERPCYRLPRRECDLVISGYSVKYRLAIIDRWHELESKQALQAPKTMTEALRLAAALAEKNTEQETLTPSSSFQRARPAADPVEG